MAVLMRIAYVLISLMVTAYVFNHVEPWAGIATGIVFVVLLVKYLKYKVNEEI